VRKKEKIDRTGMVRPTVELVITLLGVAAFTGACVIMPATPVIVTPIIKYLVKEKEKREEMKNHRFDKVRLWGLLRRLEKQKDVHFSTGPDGLIQIDLTEKGKAKHLKFKLKELEENFSRKKWDGKWRLIFFDVPEQKRSGRDQFRHFLKNLKFYPLQKSVYLTPYPCQDEIEYLRNYFGLGSQAQILVAEKLENDETYRLYFGLT